MTPFAFQQENVRLYRFSVQGVGGFSPPVWRAGFLEVGAGWAFLEEASMVGARRVPLVLATHASLDLTLGSELSLQF